MMDYLRDRFWNFAPAFKEQFTVSAVIFVAVVIVVSGVLITVLRKTGKVTGKMSEELYLRWRSWVYIAILLFVPILMGSGWVILGVCLLSLLCYREFAKVTGVFRERSISTVVVLGILLLAFASLDNFFRLFAATLPLTVAAISMIAILKDQPKGYLQRTALGILGFIFFGYCLGYMGYFVPADRDLDHSLRGTKRCLCLLLRQTHRRSQSNPQHQPRQDLVGLHRRDSLHYDHFLHPRTLRLPWDKGRSLGSPHFHGHEPQRHRSVWRPLSLLDQARCRDQGHGQRHSRPWRSARSL
jgi:hypothetical protein